MSRGLKQMIENAKSNPLPRYEPGPARAYDLKYEPTPHQFEDSRTLLEYEGGFLWAEPGTGKTFTTIMALAGAGFERAVIVCPKIALYMWKEELEKHLDWKVHVLTGPRKGVNYFYKEAIVVSYGLLSRNADIQRTVCRYLEGYAEYRTKTRPLVGFPSVLICDEAHALKSPTSKRQKTIFGSVGALRYTAVAGKATDVWQLTGTPITRHNDDLFTQLLVTRRDILKHYGVDTYEKFRDKFCVTAMRQYHPRSPKKLTVIGSKNHDLLSRLLDDCMVVKRKLADVVDDLPPITYRTVTVDHTQMDKITVPSGIDLIRELSKKDSMLAKARRQLGLAKVSAAVDYLLEVHDRAMLVGFWHISVGKAYMEALEDNGLTLGYIDGGTPDKERWQIQQDFNAGKIDVLLGQMSALGTAANLQGAANRVAVTEELMSPAELEQFIARVYRRGQRRHVQVDLIRSSHDLDSAMLGVRLNKEASVKKVI